MDPLPSITVVGLGRLGAPLAALLASRGARVAGVDRDEAAVRRVAAGGPFEEPGLAELLARHRDALDLGTDVAAAVRRSEVTFVVVPTPSTDDGGFSPRHVVDAVAAVGAALRERAAEHLVVVTSTLGPGTMDAVVAPALAAAAGAAPGLCYSPAFIALGSVLRDLSRPDFVLVGESDPRAGGRLEALLRRVTTDDARVVRTSFVNAELIKLAVNGFVTTKISFANTLARICERLPGADVDVVTAAVGLDRRVGRAYLTGAVAYGGPCFPRDSAALAQVARRLETCAALPEAVDRVNREQTTALEEAVRAWLPAGGVVGVMGLAYKPDTDVVDEAPGVLLARRLAAAGLQVVVHDPRALPAARRALGGAVAYAATRQECARRSDVVVVTTPWPELRLLCADDFARDAPRRAPPTAIDCWRILDGRALSPGVRHVRLGIGPRDPGPAGPDPQAGEEGS